MGDFRLPVSSYLDSGNVPVAELTAFADREANRSKPIYGAHRWFARRFGSVTRALLVAAVTPPDQDFWQGYYGENEISLEGATVLDCFMGGGTIGYEAKRLGASVIGVDVDPIAVTISRFELSAHQMTDTDEAFDGVWRSVGKSLLPLYQTQRHGEERVGLHYIWVQHIDCGGCGQDVEAHPSRVLGMDQDGRWVLCPDCGDVSHSPNKKFAVCDCGHRFDPEKGNVERNKVRCHCGFEEPLIDYARRTGTRPKRRLLAVESIPVTTRTRVPVAERAFHRATPQDHALYAEAERQLADVDVPHWPISAEGRQDNRLMHYGYRTYSDLFNARQLLHLTLLANAIREELPWDQQQMLGLALSNSALSSNMLCGYTAKWRQTTPLFAVRSYRHIARPVELNPWLVGVGRGTFPNAVRRVARAVNYAKAPTEFTPEGTRPVAAKPSPEADVRVADARHLAHVPTGSVDLVVTDPPYMDNIAYDELSEFFLPWLTAAGVIEPDAAQSTRTSTLAVRKRNDETADDFSDMLTEVFTELRRVLKRNGRVIFTFQHSKPSAWHAIAAALKVSGFTVINVFPVKADTNRGFHNHKQSSTHDAVFICGRTRPRKSVPDVTEPQIANAAKHVEGWAAKTVLSDADKALLMRATLAAAATRFLYETGPTTQLRTVL